MKTARLPHKASVFADHPVVSGNPAQYAEITVDIRKVLKDWQLSLLSHELIDKDGTIKPDQSLTDSRLARRLEVREAWRRGETLEKPILGIGIFDSIEIGVGSDILVTLAMEGVTALPVHVRAAQIKEFKAFIV